jgi:hypothetical protein
VERREERLVLMQIEMFITLCANVDDGDDLKILNENSSTWKKTIYGAVYCFHFQTFEARCNLFSPKKPQQSYRRNSGKHFLP